MRRKDMVPGVLYAIVSNGVTRPGVIHDASNERIRAWVWWSWPPFTEPGEGEYPNDEMDYLDPQPKILDPRAKYDDKTVKTSDVLQEWEPWATEQKRSKEERWKAHLETEEREAAERQAEQDRNVHRIERLRPMLEGAVGYLDIDHLRRQAATPYYWNQTAYSAGDVVSLLEQIAPRTFNGEPS